LKQILAFVLLSGLICWFMFSPIYRHVLVMRQAALQQEVDYLLETGANASHGYIDAAMIAASKSRLEARGFDVSKLEYIVRSDAGVPADSPAAPLVRGTGLELTIRYPAENLLDIDQLIGISPPGDSAYIQATGVKMSEYVP
jgi:hypothetical protein